MINQINKKFNFSEDELYNIKIYLKHREEKLEMICQQLEDKIVGKQKILVP